MILKSLPTEQRNANTMDIDEVSTLEMIRKINNEDKQVAQAMEKHLASIAAAVDAMSEVFANGGRIVYCGAGTSGRLGVIDASECLPTYSVVPGRVIGLIAGGEKAMYQPVEGAEDSYEQCVVDLKAINFTKDDVLVGIAASGRTPYPIGGLRYANDLGAVTVSITCNEDPNSPMSQLAKYPIGIFAGPEVITGSTRMKAGTIQKMVLNMLSTGVMVKNGKVYGNMMVNVQISNEKLQDRAERIIAQVTEKDSDKIKTTLTDTENDVCLSIFMLLTDLPKDKAEEYLQNNNGHIKQALKAVEQDRA